MSKKREFIKTKAVMNRSLFALVGIILGMMIILQSKVLPTRVTNSITPYMSLKDTKELLYSEQTSLKGEASDLQNKITAMNNGNSGALSSSDASLLNMKRAQAGLTKLNGAGVIITFDDSKRGLTSEDSIVHAADLRDIINLLWGSTAEGIAMNGERIVTSTSVDCIVNTVLVNDTRISNPFSIEAIGDMSTMYERLNDPNILSDIHTRVTNNGIIFRIEKNSNITMPAFSGVLSVQSPIG